MDDFIWTTTLDFYGNPQEEKRFGISLYINNEKTENFLNNIDDTIEKNIFRNDILIESFQMNFLMLFQQDILHFGLMKCIGS